MLPFLFLALLVVTLFGNTLFPPAEKIIYGGDVLTQFYFWKGYLAENIKNSIIPFWNPYNFSGTPFLAHPSTTFFYPSTLLFVFLPLNLAFSLNFAIHLLIAGIGMYKLVRSYTKNLAALSGALVFILGGFFASRVYAGHVEIFSTVVWIPWVFWSVWKLFSEPSKKNFFYLILFFSLEILAGYMAVVLFTVELITFYLIYKFLSVIPTEVEGSLIQKTHEERFLGKLGMTNRVRNIILVLVALFFALGITTIQWLPVFEFVKLSIRGNGLPYELSSWGSLPVSGLKLFFDPYNQNELAKLPYGFGGYDLPNFFEYYIGKVVIVTVFIFIFLHLINRIIPFIVRANKVSRELFMNITSRLGFQPRSKNNILINDLWFFLVMIFIFLWLSFGNQVKINLHFLFYQLIPFYRNIRIPAQHLIMIVFILPIMFGLIIDKIKNKWLQLAILLLVVVELFPYSKKFYLLADLPEKKYDKNLLELLPSLPEKPRLLPNFSVVSKVLDSFDFNAALKFHLPTTSGYDPMILRSYYEFIERLNSSKQSMIPYYNVEIPPIDTKSAMLDFLNIGYILTEPITPPLDTAKYQILIKNEKYTLYKNKNPNSRFYFTSQNDNLICPDVAKSDVILSKYSANEIIITTQTNCDGILSSSEVYYPGWKATIDGKETLILKSNYAFRAISLPKGIHTVRFFYSPDIYILGSLISLFSLLGSILFIKICYKPFSPRVLPLVTLLLRRVRRSHQ